MTETEEWINESLKNLPYLCKEIRRLSEENDALRSKLTTKTDNQLPNDPLTAECAMGLTQKYIVVKAKNGEPVHNCFVLRPDKDPAAVIAIRAYAGATDNETLKSDLYAWVGTETNVPMTLEELREMDEESLWVSFGENVWHVFIQRKTCDGILTYENNFLWFASYGKTWLAYLRNPKEV